jgi:hypothetical protein
VHSNDNQGSMGGHDANAVSGMGVRGAVYEIERG